MFICVYIYKLNKNNTKHVNSTEKCLKSFCLEYNKNNKKNVRTNFDGSHRHITIL